jgi:hypothetical protein
VVGLKKTTLFRTFCKIHPKVKKRKNLACVVLFTKPRRKAPCSNFLGELVSQKLAGGYKPFEKTVAPKGARLSEREP